MNEKTLTFLEKEIPGIYAYASPKDSTDTDAVTENAVQKSDEELFVDALPSTGNHKLYLLYALYRAEQEKSRENILAVAAAAAKTNDFVTALYWHEKVPLTMPRDISVKFERYFYRLLADKQKEEQPDTVPITSMQQYLPHRSELSRTLRDPKYREVEAAYLKKKEELSRQRYSSDEFHRQLQSVEKRNSVSDTLASIYMVLCWIAGLYGLWKTVPMVWNRVDNALFQLLAVVAYIPIFALVVIWVSSLFLNKSDNRLKNFFSSQQTEIESIVCQTDEYKAFRMLNEGLPEKFWNYPKRLILAALTAMTGETDFEKLCEFADVENAISVYRKLLRCAWVPKCVAGPYKTKILSLAREDASDTKLAEAIVFYRMDLDERKKKNGSILETTNARGQKKEFLESVIDIYGIMRSDEEYKGEVTRKPFNHLRYLPLRFLEAEYKEACRTENHDYIGDICYRLYNLGTRFHDHLDDKDWREISCHYGCIGVKYSDKLKFEAMKYHAVYEETRNGLLSLGFCRDDAEDYCRELYKKGDPRWKEMQAALDSAKRFDEEYAREKEFREAEAERQAELAALRREEERKENIRREMEEKFDSIERTVDMEYGGSGRTVEERALRGEVSDLDAMYHQDKRERLIKKKTE